MISFGGEYTRKQWGQGIRIAMHPTGRAFVLRLAALLLVLGVVIALLISVLQGEAPDSSWIIRTAFSVALLVLWAAVPYWRAWRAAVAPWRAAKGPLSLMGTITNEGIRSNASGGGDGDRWESFLAARTRQDMVVLIGADGLATILPRTFFASEFDWQAFRHMVEFKVVTPK